MDRKYLWFLTHMGKVEEKSRQWVPGKHPGLLRWLNGYIEDEVNQRQGAEWDRWFVEQERLLK